MRQGLLLYNPAAGRLSARSFLRGPLKILRAAGWQTDVAVTLNGTHATQAARQAATEHYDAVFAIGGDGTIGQVTGGLIGTETALGVFPAGSTNVLARELGMKPFNWYRPWALRESAKLLAESSVQHMDVGLCDERVFLLWAGIGLDALTIHKLEPRSRFVKYMSVPHYFATTVWEATFWHGMDLLVWTDGKQVDGHFLLAVATNIRRYLGGMAVISPEAYFDDGLMDLWLFSGNNLADAFRHFFDMLAGRHFTSDQVRRLPFQSARIESNAPFSLQMDGEPMLGSARIGITVQPRALKMLMPPHSLNLLRHPVS